MNISNVVTRFNGFSIWVRIALGVVAAVLLVFVAMRFSEGIKTMIFGNVEAKRERGNTEVAKEQTKAEGKIADATIQTVHERDVYREHITQVVHDGQERIHAVDKGQQMDPAIDAAGAAALCSVHDSLCRRPGAEAVQPVR